MFYNYFVELCNRAKISPSKAAQQIGLSKSSVSGWKNGSVPRDSQIMRIADFFGIPVSDIYSVVNSQREAIFNRTEFEKYTMNRAEKATETEKAPMPNDIGEENILRMYRSLSTEEKGALYAYALSLKDKQKEGE
jgi:transcriptional regulator with XRE-family HTH domain